MTLENGLGNGNGLLVKIGGAAVVAIVIGWGSYLSASAAKAQEVDVFRAEIRGELALIKDQQTRMQDDVKGLTRLIERMAERDQRRNERP